MMFTLPFKMTDALNIMRSNWSILIGIAIGVYIGLLKPDYAVYIAPIGDIYLDILKMCILPILLSAIAVSIGKLLKTRRASDTSYIGKMLWMFLASVLMASFLGTTVGILGQPGKSLESSSLSSLGSIIRDSDTPDIEIFLFEPYKAEEKVSIIKNFFINLVPENIFSALSNGSNLKVLFFAILFGLAVGALNEKSSDHLILSLESIYSAFAKLVSWLMFFLPLGLCGLIASNLSQVGIDVLLAMMKFVPIVLIGFLALFIISSLVMWYRVGSLSKPFFALKETIIIALGTGNSLACLPSSLSAMHKGLGYEKKSVDLLIPLAFTLCRTGPTLYFATATVFVAQLYDVPLDFEAMSIVLFGSILAGMATAGSSGIVLLSMLSLVLSPLDLPVDAVLILFIAIDPIIGPFRVLAITHTACAITTVVLPKPNKDDNLFEEASVEEIQAVERREN